MTEAVVERRYLSAGANRYAWAADWSKDGIVAFGSDCNVCLWDPRDPRGISQIISGHTAHVRAVTFLPRHDDDKALYLATGGDDKQLRLWSINAGLGTASCVQSIEEHAEPINCIASLSYPASSNAARRILVTGAADATVKVWTFDGSQLTLIQTIKTPRRFMPLAVALYGLEDGGLLLAVAGTTNAIHIFTASPVDATASPEFTPQATLPGHENWIRSLDFVREKPEGDSDILLASASQDKYIRLWRIHQGTALSALNASGLALTTDALTLSNKIHKISAGATKYCIMFEALLLGHEDWIYTARWNRAADGRLQLLSASADNSLAVWESDPGSGIWITVARLGEISREKGATTATGSIGGFWTGLWSPEGTTVITLGRTGSWRRWDYDAAEDMWKQTFAVTGHTRSVTGISWSPDGSYLLSTSSDQTTRLHAPWLTGPSVGSSPSWHEMSRPQIHGYDLNCISTLGPTSFVSGADEKLKRVFTEPRAVARLLNRLSGTPAVDEASSSSTTLAADAADMPVLGLSNKAITDAVLPSEQAPADLSIDINNKEEDADATAQNALQKITALDNLTHPPLEESLSRHTLWPETEKLYGHGYELSCLAATRDGSLIASACKASSLNHAVIRVFETARWTELHPPLQAHSLTVTRLRFAPPEDGLLLSVSRDRGWAVWRRRRGQGRDGKKGVNPFELWQRDAKGHSRMVLDCAWAPPVVVEKKEGETASEQQTVRMFATAGRDKVVKLWLRKEKAGGADEEDQQEAQFEPGPVLTEEHAVTAVDFAPEPTRDGELLLGVGTEAGRLAVLGLRVIVAPEGEAGVKVEVASTWKVPDPLCLPKAVLQLAWRPRRGDGLTGERELAIAGEDGSLRIYAFPGLL
ncbi:hypothetical protein VTJ04DRAFT_8015 [Mycothermus thermophilus]|uniref:uncharacterized protein n=1 Tax=Humicola insolens TaxID=85995 RepID=UPI003742802B